VKHAASKRQLALGVVLLLVAVLLALWLLVSIVTLFGAADDNVQAAIVAGLFAAFAAIGGWIYQDRRARFDRHKEKKVAVYAGLIELVFDLQKMHKDEGPQSTDEIIESTDFKERYWSLGKNLTLWASPKVIRAFHVAFKPKQGTEAREVLSNFDKLYRQIRDDLGLANRGLKEFDLVGMLVNDIDELQAATSTVEKSIVD